MSSVILVEGMTLKTISAGSSNTMPFELPNGEIVDPNTDLRWSLGYQKNTIGISFLLS